MVIRMTLHTKSEDLYPARVANVAWTSMSRKTREARMDSETSVSLRCHLFEDFANAKSWTHLIDNLAAKDFYLIFERGRLVLVNAFNGLDICTCRFLGFSFETLSQTLGKPCVVADSGRIIAPPPRQ